MAENLQVALVAADRTVWQGEATLVLARTIEGDLGVLRGHAPLLSLLAPSVVEIETVDGQRVYAATEGGFISVANDRVSILSERASLAGEIDLAAAQAALAEAQGGDDELVLRRAEARVAAAERLR